MTPLAQTLGQTLETPQIAWSWFAPELLVGAAALHLLLLAVAGKRRATVAIPVGVIGVALGAFLIAGEQLVPGVVAMAAGAFAVAAVFGFGIRPSLIPPWTAAMAFLGALVLTIWQYTDVMQATGSVSGGLELQGSVALDGIALFTRLTVYGAAFLSVPMGHGYLEDRGINRPEFEPLLLLSTVGMAMLGSASDLITLFVALEILSLALYVMVSLARRDRRSQESGVKYFVMGAVASAILLYGMALLYVATGSLELGEIAERVGLIVVPQRPVVIGLALVTIGIGFKVALAPFQAWTPDVYQGAPTNVTGFMAAATKAAGFAAVLRLFLLTFGDLQDLWVPIVAVLATASMVYGAVAALVQRDVKRILAYSSIAHAGYAAIGVASASQDGLAGTLWYLLTYAVTTITAFAAVIAIERRRRGEVALVDLRGLGTESPALAVFFGVALLSLAGIPGTAGFVGKLQVFSAGVGANLEWLVVIGVVTSAIAAFFYLRLIGLMFLEEPAETERPALNPSTGLSFAISAGFAFIVFLGIQPGIFLTLAERVAFVAR